MGHTEMLLAVAGLSQKGIEERFERLAAGDWSSFSPAECAAFGFAQKLAKDPLSVSNRDIRLLVEQFGSDGAIDVIWWSCRCHFMTCVSDAFQLQLERDNVFDGFLPAPVGR